MIKPLITALLGRIKSGPVVAGRLVVAAVAALQFAADPVCDRLRL